MLNDMEREKCPYFSNTSGCIYCTRICELSLNKCHKPESAEKQAQPEEVVDPMTGEKVTVYFEE